MKLTKIYTTLMLAVLLTVLSSKSFSQTKPSPTVSDDETISFLLAQNKEAKNVIAAQEKRIADLETELAAEKDNSASIGKSYESAKSEITSLKQSNDALARAVAINESTIVALQTDNAKQREKAKRASRDKWKIIAIAAGAIAVKFLIP